jgi:hypothetical protein
MIALTPIALWEDEPEAVKAVTGRSVHTLKRWSAREGLTVHTRGKGSGKRDYWLTDEVLAFLRATGRTNHDSAADRGE